MTYPHITFGQNVKQEPSDKFICFERHGLLAVIIGIIPPEKRDMAIPNGEDAVIADGDPVGISAEVLKNAFGTIKGRFAVDNPLLFIELLPEKIEVAGCLYSPTLSWMIWIRSLRNADIVSSATPTTSSFW